jgi:very-short-patch-repair endonuclease
MGMKLSDLPPGARDRAAAILAAQVLEQCQRRKTRKQKRDGSNRKRGKKRVSQPQPESILVSTLVQQLHAEGIRCFDKEHPFQRWFLDLAFVPEKISVECQGGIHSRGRHVRAQGYSKDREKHNALALAGWIPLEVTMQQIRRGQALEWILEALNQKTPLE